MKILEKGSKAKSQSATVQSQNKKENPPLNPVLIQKYIYLVDQVVRRQMRVLPSHIEQDDLRSVGIIGLVSAIRRYDPVQGNTFDAYATLRIRGAILDELRRMDCMPRTARAKARKLQSTIQTLEQRFGRSPSEAEIQGELGLNNKEFTRMRLHASPVNFISLDSTTSHSSQDELNLHEAIPDDAQRPSYEGIQKRETIRLLAEKIESLPVRQKKILSMYYFEGMRLAEIASVYGVTEARICQIHGAAVNMLRRQLEKAVER